MKAKFLIVFALLLSMTFYAFTLQYQTLRDRLQRNEMILAGLDRLEQCSVLIHHLQRERGLTVQFLAGVVGSAAEDLAQQRAATDSALATLQRRDAFFTDMALSVATARQALDQDGSDANLAFSRYSVCILQTLDYNFNANLHTEAPSTAEEFKAYSHLLYAKEYLGQLRAYLSEVYAHKTVGNTQVLQVTERMQMHVYHRDLFAALAPPGLLPEFRQILEAPDTTEVYALVEAYTARREVRFRADAWFDLASQVVDRFFRMEQLTRAYIAQTTTEALDRSNTSLRLLSTVAALFALFTVAGALRVIYSIMRNVETMEKDIGSVIKTGNFSYRLKIGGNAELDHLAGHFNKLLRLVEALLAEKDLLAATDKLTGAVNRHKFSEIFQQELTRTQRYGGTFSLVMLDIDHFKRINDSRGHLTGDEVLRQTTSSIQAAIRKNDLFARWGGEEFVLLLPASPGSAAQSLAEKLRLMLQEQVFDTDLRITVSFGVTEHRPGDTLETMIARADEALYTCKRNGRNQVCLA